MKTDELLLYKALHLKATHHNQFLFDAIDAGSIKIEGVQTRNICAQISQELFANVEACCELLNISKRQLVECALFDVLDKAHKIIADVDPMGDEGVNIVEVVE